MRRLFAAVPIAVIAVGVSGCATKNFVRSSVGAVNTRVDELGRTVEETQERTRQNEQQIAQVDQKATAADTRAQGAAQAAQVANTAAGNAATAAAAAGTKVDELDRVSRRLVYTVVLNTDDGNFGFNSADLPDSAKGKIDGMIRQLQQDPKNVFIEIEGHTDNVGGNQVNEKVGLARAEAVLRYLHEQHQIPLHKMSAISYGETKPVAPNNTREGRAQNRRVVIKVLA